MSSHILQEVTDVCDEVALIDKGKLLFYDTLANVTTRFADGHPTIDVGLARPLAGEASLKDVAAIPGGTSCGPLEPKRLRLKFSGGPEDQERLLEALVSLRIGVKSLSESESVLEDIYMKQVARGD